jgi:hypothetical protein
MKQSRNYSVVCVTHGEIERISGAPRRGTARDIFPADARPVSGRNLRILRRVRGRDLINKENMIILIIYTTVGGKKILTVICYFFEKK